MMVVVPTMVAAPSAVAAVPTVIGGELHAFFFGIGVQLFEIGQDARLRRRAYGWNTCLRLWQNCSNRCCARKTEQAFEKQSSIHALPLFSYTNDTAWGQSVPDTGGNVVAKERFRRESFVARRSQATEDHAT